VANLSGANLRGAEIQRANLEDANLTGADLTEAHLYGAKLREANLREANLRGANLTVTNLRLADLTGANLRGAWLTGANLRGARVERASLALAINVDPTGVVYVDPFALRDDLLVLDEIDVCPICHEEGGPGVLTTCEHEFHASCLLEWKRTGRGGCPMCRGEGTFFGTVRRGSK
jgi:hypothetical protein